MNPVDALKAKVSKEHLFFLRGTMTDQQIANKYDCTINMVRKLAKEYEIPSRKELNSPRYRDKELDKRASQFDNLILLVDIPSGEVLINRLAEHR